MRTPGNFDIEPPVPWWETPKKDRWLAYLAAWLGGRLDVFDRAIFLPIMVPIANRFGVPPTAAAVGFTIAPSLCPIGADALGSADPAIA